MERIMLLCKEEKKDGGYRYTRIPWDLVALGQTSGLSPVPVPTSFDTRVQTAAYTLELNDLFKYEGEEDEMNDITGIQWFDSEQDFYALYGRATGFYNSDPSAEFGY